MGELPVDNIYNILSRMPLKSLARFRCVSKLWFNYINDPYLEIMHAKRAMKDPTMLIMFQLVQHHDLPNSPYTSALSILETKEEESRTSTQEVITKKSPYMEYCCKDWGSRFILADIILGSCNGLIYSSQDHPNGTALLVINPLKKECYKLPPIKIWSCTSVFHERESCGLGFDDSTNTFKMVCVVLRNQEIMRSPYHDVIDVVKKDLCTMVHVMGTDSWREIPQVPPYPISGEAVFANGCLHWLVSDHLRYWPFYVGRKVICFDMRKEEFGLINPPSHVDCGREHLVDLDGQVGLVYNDIGLKCSIEVWLLKQTKWVIHCRLDQKPPLPQGSIKVLGYWNKDGDLLITDSLRKRLFVYSLKDGVLQEANFIYQKNARQTDIRVYQSTFFSVLHSIKR